MASLINPAKNDKALENNVELLQQMALLKWLMSKGDESSTLYKWVTASRIGNELYQRVSGKRKIDEYRAECLTGIVAYIQKHPKASAKSLQAEVERLIGIFILQLKAL